MLNDRNPSGYTNCLPSRESRLVLAPKIKIILMLVSSINIVNEKR